MQPNPPPGRLFQLFQHCKSWL